MPSHSSEKSIAILEATLSVIAQGGVDAVRYRDVAREAKVPLGTVSYNFPNRTDLIHAAFRLFLEQSSAVLAATRARLPSETLEEVAELLASFARAYLADRGRCVAEYELMVCAARDPDLHQALTTWDRARQSELAILLERLDVPRPNNAAQTLMDMIRGFQLTAIGQERPDFDGLQKRLRDLIHALAGSPAF